MQLSRFVTKFGLIMTRFFNSGKQKNAPKQFFFQPALFYPLNKTPSNRKSDYNPLIKQLKLFADNRGKKLVPESMAQILLPEKL